MGSFFRDAHVNRGDSSLSPTGESPPPDFFRGGKPKSGRSHPGDSISASFTPMGGNFHGSYVASPGDLKDLPAASWRSLWGVRGPAQRLYRRCFVSRCSLEGKQLALTVGHWPELPITPLARRELVPPRGGWGGACSSLPHTFSQPEGSTARRISLAGGLCLGRLPSSFGDRGPEGYAYMQFASPPLPDYTGGVYLL